VFGGDVGIIGKPDRIRRGCREVLPTQLRRNRQVLPTVGSTGSEWAPRRNRNAVYRGILLEMPRAFPECHADPRQQDQGAGLDGAALTATGGVPALWAVQAMTLLPRLDAI
jgi:hypothetical protein